MKAWIEVSRTAITHNISQIRKAIGNETELMAVVKANAYGHGLIETARTAIHAGANWLGITSLAEAVSLREAGVTVPILTFFEPEIDEIQELIKLKVSCCIFSEETARKASEIALKLGEPLRCHIKVNTGMNRLGVRFEDAIEFFKRTTARPGLLVEGVFSHLATAETPNDLFAATQIKRFEECRKKLKDAGVKYFHIANSGGAIYYPESRMDLVRIGIAMYGYFPSPDSPKTLELVPSLALKGKVLAINTVMPGEGVSYGLTWKAKRVSRIAICPIGYGDGILRGLSGKLEAYVDGVSVKSVGTICMDLLALDVTETKAAVGDTVTLIGGNISAESLAVKARTISYEILTRLGARLPRVFVD